MPGTPAFRLNLRLTPAGPADDGRERSRLGLKKAKMISRLFPKSIFFVILLSLEVDWLPDGRRVPDVPEPPDPGVEVCLVLVREGLLAQAALQQRHERRQNRVVKVVTHAQEDRAVDLLQDLK